MKASITVGSQNNQESTTTLWMQQIVAAEFKLEDSRGISLFPPMEFFWVFTIIDSPTPFM